MRENNLTQEKHTGGMAMTDFNLRWEANITNIRKMESQVSQPWSALHIYWFGFYLKFLYPHFARNIYVHTLNAPKVFSYLSRRLTGELIG